MPTIIFSHGKESGPYGKKIQLLIAIAHEHHFETKSIDYRGLDDVNERVELLRKELKQLDNENVILVGSSMGGYVSTVIATEFPLLGLFLLCPALYMEAYDVQEYPVITKKIMIIHGWNDDVIPYQHSINFGFKHNGIVYLTTDNHRLSHSRAELGQQFTLFIQSVKTGI